MPEQESGHVRVSNQPQMSEAALPAGAIRPQAPSTGQAPKVARTRRDGTETVPGGPAPASAGNRPQSASAGESTPAPEASGFDDEEETRLPDVAIATFGVPPAPPFVVIGPDDRRQINDTATYPWRAHASLLITARDNSKWIGTGWFISPRTLITAGHCVYLHGNVPARVGWAKSIEVMPGRNGATVPFGPVTSTVFHSVTGWTQSGSADFDYAAIVLPTPLGDTVGWFGFGVYDDADLAGAVLNISGYPGDKPSGTQWYHFRQTKSVNPKRVFYEVDTAGGQSGSAVYRIISGKRYAVAIHAYGDSTANSGTRINNEVYNNLMSWKA